MKSGWRLLLCAVVVAAAQAQNQYCQFTTNHTLCQFQGPGPACDQLRSRTVSAQEAKYIVAEHNRLRARIANGREARGKPFAQPPASNMRQLVWDEELARVAQRHAEQCVFQHDCRDCKRVARFKVGQNLYISSSTRLEDIPEWKRALYAWYDEVALFDPQRIEPFVFETAIGHYTQMAWADTDRIGCGYTLYRDGPWWSKLYVCNYGPAGNFQRGQMYQRGASCSSCPPATICSRQFPGICAADDGIGATLVPTTTVGLATTRPTRPTLRPTTQRPTVTTVLPSRPPIVATVVPSTRPPTTSVLPSRRPAADGQVLFSCDLDSAGCRVKYGGTTWKIVRTKSKQGRILGTAVTFGRRTKLTFQGVVMAPSSGDVCVAFAYMKYELRGSRPVQLVVSLEPTAGGRPVRAVVRQNARGQLRRQRVQMRRVAGQARLRFSAAVPSLAFGQATVIALDDVQVTSGRCQ